MSVNYKEYPLTDALTELAHYFGTTIVYDGNIVTDNDKATIKGIYKKIDLLHALLDRASLEAKVSESGFVSIIRKHKAIATNADTSDDLEDDRNALIEIPVIYVTARNETVNIANANLKSTPSNLSIIEFPQTIEFFDLAFLDERQYFDVGDLLRDIANINMFGYSSGTSFRGFKASETDFFRDGAPLVIDMRMPIPFTDIKRVEILKGANSMKFGQGGQGGLINLIRKQPNRIGSTTLKAHYGNDRSLVNIDINPVSNTQSFSQRYNFHYSRDGSYFIGDDLQYYAISPSWRWQNEDSDWLLRFDYFLKEIDGAVVSYRAKDLKSESLYTGIGAKPDNSEKAETFDINIGYNKTVGGGWDIFSKFALGTGEVQSRYHNEFLFPDFSELYSEKFPRFYQYLAENNDTASRVYTQLDVLRNFEFGSSQHTISIGIRTVHYKHKLKNLMGYNQEIFDAGQSLELLGKSLGDLQLTEIGSIFKIFSQLSWYNPNVSTYEVGIQLPDVIDIPGLDSDTIYYRDSFLPLSNLDSSSTEMSIYFNDSIQFANNWIAVIGLGYQTYRKSIDHLVLDVYDITITDGWIGTRPESDVIVPSASQVAQSNFHQTSRQRYTIEQTALTPSLGITYLMSPALSIFANYGKQYQAVSGIDSLTGEDFELSLSDTFEIGTKYLINSELSFTASTFEISSDNQLRQRDAISAVRYQDGEIKVTGYEANLKGYITPNINITAQYAKLEAEMTNNGTEEIWNTSYSPVSGRLWLQYHFEPYGIHGTSLSLGYHYSAEKEGKPERLPGYDIYDLAVLYRSHQFSSGIYVDHVTNDEWVPPVSG